MPSDKFGDPPEWLNPMGKNLWHRIIELMGDKLEKTDESALTLMCASFGAAYEALKDLNERGPLIEGDRGMVKNPANQVAREQGAQFKLWASEFGLTPAARKKLAMSIGADSESEDLIT
jgi:P27 family predicted phage terminase small subunit